MLPILNQLHLELHWMDVKTAFINGDLEEEIFVRLLEGFTDKNNLNIVCKLQKSLYGLKLSACCWNKTIDEFLMELGYTQNDADPCIYHKRFIKGNQACILIMALYVDDLLIASNEVHYILRICIMRSQKRKITSVLRRFGMEDCKPVATSLEPGAKFEKLNDDKVMVKLKEFQSAIGPLTYASIGTSPDILAAMGVLSQRMSKTGKQHRVSVKRVLHYIEGTPDYGLQYKATNVDGVTNSLHGYTDAD